MPLLLLPQLDVTIYAITIADRLSMSPRVLRRRHFPAPPLAADRTICHADMPLILSVFFISPHLPIAATPSGDIVRIGDLPPRCHRFAHWAS